MIVQVHPSSVSGKIYAPASKSSMQRSCAAALLAKGTSRIFNPGVSNDDKAALDVIQKLGATVTWQEDGSIEIKSEGVKPVSPEINCSESGLGIRMFTPIAALSSNALLLNGTGSLLRRPMDFFDEIFPGLDIAITSTAGKLPIRIQGPLKPTNIEIDGSLSSQFLTGLLMAFGSSVTAPVTIKVNDLKSRPYIDLTLKVMKIFGREVINDNYCSFSFEASETGYQPQTYTVEGDWSGAAFLLVAGAVSGSIEVEGLDIHSPQADKAVLEALKACNADIIVNNDKIVVRSRPMKAFDFDATDCPDLFPPLVALASFCNGSSRITGVSRLTHKESNRALTLQEEFAKLGVTIELHGDTMLITGLQFVKAAQVHSRHDHRIAMACAVAGLRAKSVVEIDEAEAINKSYPDFFEDLQALGANVVVSQQ